MSALLGRRRALVLAPSTGWTAAIAATAAVAVAARLPQVFLVPFWQDEVASARIIREPTLAAVLHRVRLTESTPPLWYVLAWLGHLAGVSLRDERLLSVAFGGALAACTVVLAARVVPRAAALLAGLGVALGNEFVLHGHELRSYELVALLACLFGLCLVRELDQPSRRRELALAVCVAAGGSSHYYFAFPVISALAWLWLDRAARPIRARATTAICAGGVVACIWLPMMLRQYAQNRFSWIGPFSLRGVLAVPLRLFTVAGSGTTIGLAASLLFLAAALFGAARLARMPAGRMAIVLALAPVVEAAAAWLAGSDTFDLRNLIVVGPFVAILAAAAVAAFPRRAAGPIAVSAAAALALGIVSVAGRGPAYDEIARNLVRDGWTSTASIAVYGDPRVYRSPLEWYLPHQPQLAVARPHLSTCVRVFLVRPSGRIVVLRRAALRQLRHTTLLEAAAHRAACPASPQRERA